MPDERFGLRVERGVSYHGIALNIAVDLADFGLIDACGMAWSSLFSQAPAVFMALKMKCRLRKISR